MVRMRTDAPSPKPDSGAVAGRSRKPGGAPADRVSTIVQMPIRLAAGLLAAALIDAATPTPVLTMGIGQLGTAYLGCVNPYKNATKLASLKSWSKQEAVLQGTLLGCVRKIPWPSKLADGDVHTLLVKGSALQVTWLAESRVSSRSGYDDLVKTENKQVLDARSASNQLRGDLGLPAPATVVARGKFPPSSDVNIAPRGAIRH
jgi:hypothetical protein